MGAQDRKSYWILRHATLTVNAGDVLILSDQGGTRGGPMLRMLCGLLHPDVGTVAGPTRAVLLSPPHKRLIKSLSVGQGIRMLGGLYGMTDAEIAERYEEIVEFAEVRKLISKPMDEIDPSLWRQVAFAVGTSAPVELIGIDSMSAVGSTTFRAKCLPRLRQRVADGTALAVIGGSADIVSAIGTRAVELRKGRVVEMAVGTAADLAREQATQRRELRRARRRAGRRDEDDDDDYRDF